LTASLPVVLHPGEANTSSPHIEHRQEVIAATGVRDGHHHWLFGQIEPAAGIERIEIGPHHAHIGGTKGADIGEAIHGTADASRLWLLIGELLPSTTRSVTLRHPEVLEQPANQEGVLTFDLAVDGRE